MRLRSMATAAMCLAALAGCASRSTVPMGEAAFPAAGASGPPEPAAPLAEYRIGPLDTLAVTVFGEKDLSVEELPVSLAGRVSMPLVGEVDAAGRTAAELGRDIADRLNGRYLRDAQVAVSVAKSVNLTVTVEGEVRKPGIYDIPGGRLTLLQAVALGEGTTEYARLNEVIVVRTIDGRRYAARFDLRDIRAARTPDPAIRQSDVVVVGYSRATRLFRDALGVLPGAAGLFVAIQQ